MVLPIQLFKNVDCRLKKLEKKKIISMSQNVWPLSYYSLKSSIQIITKLIVKRVF